MGPRPLPPACRAGALAGCGGGRWHPEAAAQLPLCCRRVLSRCGRPSMPLLCCPLHPLCLVPSRSSRAACSHPCLAEITRSALQPHRSPEPQPCPSLQRTAPPTRLPPTLRPTAGGDSYNLVEFVACGLAQNAMLNAAKDPGGEGEGVSGGGPGHAGPHSGGCTCCGSRQGGGNASGAAAGGAGAAAAAAAAEQPPPGDPAGWRVSQLKAFLSSKGVDHKHCLEKGQLADLRREQLDSDQQTAAEPAAAPAPSSGAAADAASPPADAPHPRPVKACAECGAAAGQPGVRLRRCAGCPRQAAPHYCGEQCQTRAWPRHKRECGSRTAAAAATG